MYKVVSFHPDESVFCYKIHYKSRTLTDCWAYLGRDRSGDLHVIDHDDQICDSPATGSMIWDEGDCVFFQAGNNGSTNPLRRAVA
jgi:hypothetical protein